jgi:hypothetical protein
MYLFIIPFQETKVKFLFVIARDFFVLFFLLFMFLIGSMLFDVYSMWKIKSAQPVMLESDLSDENVE